MAKRSRGNDPMTGNPQMGMQMPSVGGGAELGKAILKLIKVMERLESTERKKETREKRAEKPASEKRKTEAELKEQSRQHDIGVKRQIFLRDLKAKNDKWELKQQAKNTLGEVGQALRRGEGRGFVAQASLVTGALARTAASRLGASSDLAAGAGAITAAGTREALGLATQAAKWTVGEAVKGTTAAGALTGYSRRLQREGARIAHKFADMPLGLAGLTLRDMGIEGERAGGEFTASSLISDLQGQTMASMEAIKSQSGSEAQYRRAAGRIRDVGIQKEQLSTLRNSVLDTAESLFFMEGASGEEIFERAADLSRASRGRRMRQLEARRKAQQYMEQQGMLATTEEVAGFGDDPMEYTRTVDALMGTVLGERIQRD